jgi:hypothetical protein
MLYTFPIYFLYLINSATVTDTPIMSIAQPNELRSAAAPLAITRSPPNFKLVDCIHSYYTLFLTNLYTYYVRRRCLSNAYKLRGGGLLVDAPARISSGGPPGLFEKPTPPGDTLSCAKSHGAESHTVRKRTPYMSDTAHLSIP